MTYVTVSFAVAALVYMVKQMGEFWYDTESRNR